MKLLALGGARALRERITKANAARRGRRRFALPGGLLALVLTVAVVAPVVHAAPASGLKITIHAQNRFDTDVPFCGVGGGMVGDRLDVNVSMDVTGAVTGTAEFQDAIGNVTVIDVAHITSFFSGIVLTDAAGVNAIAIWMTDDPALTSPSAFASSQTYVNVELPRGCGNTRSTFTPGVDRVDLDIKYQ